jgi:SAM-dependent methyltransferase
VNDVEKRGNRLKPSFFGDLATRYYYLKELKREVEVAANVFLANKKREKLILADFGCGNKPYEEVFTPLIDKYIGLDIELNDYASVLIKEDGTIDLQDESVDVVLSTQVLEHVPDPNLYLKESFRILRKGGILILSTHGYWMYHPDPTDFWRWTSMGLKKVVSNQGFEIVSFKGILGKASMGLQLFQDGLLHKAPKFLHKPIAWLLQPLIIFFDKIWKKEERDRDACTFVLVAKK